MRWCYTGKGRQYWVFRALHKKALIERECDDVRDYDAGRVRVFRIDESIEGFRYQRRADPQEGRGGCAEPLVAKRAGQVLAGGPIGRQSGVGNPIFGELVRHLDLKKFEVAQGRWLRNTGMDQNLEQSCRRVRRAIEYFVAPGVPSTRDQETTAAVERLVPREAPEDHSGEDPMFQSDQDFLDSPRA